MKKQEELEILRIIEKRSQVLKGTWQKIWDSV